MPLPAERFKIFISHATYPDSDLANWIADSLDRLHIRAYVYERYQMGGQNRFEIIKSMISECQYFLVILTRDGIQSKWVNQEIGYAVAMNKDIIPVIEFDYSTNRLIESKGFVELNDPIHLDRNNMLRMMIDLVHTFYSLATYAKQWHDVYFLSCQCGHEFDGQLKFLDNWTLFLNDPEKKAFIIPWLCPQCGHEVFISFPDCHLMSTPKIV